MSRRRCCCGSANCIIGTDDFNRPDEDPVSGWDDDTLNGVALSGNQLVISNNDIVTFSKEATDVQNEQRVEVTATADNEGDIVIVGLMYQDEDNYFYAEFEAHDTEGRMRLFVVVDGTVRQLGVTQDIRYLFPPGEPTAIVVCLTLHGGYARLAACIGKCDQSPVNATKGWPYHASTQLTSGWLGGKAVLGAVPSSSASFDDFEFGNILDFKPPLDFPEGTPEICQSCPTTDAACGASFKEPACIPGTQPAMLTASVGGAPVFHDIRWDAEDCEGVICPWFGGDHDLPLTLDYPLTGQCFYSDCEIFDVPDGSCGQCPLPVDHPTLTPQMSGLLNKDDDTGKISFTLTFYWSCYSLSHPCFIPGFNGAEVAKYTAVSNVDAVDDCSSIFPLVLTRVQPQCQPGTINNLGGPPADYCVRRGPPPGVLSAEICDGLPDSITVSIG